MFPPMDLIVHSMGGSLLAYAHSEEVLTVIEALSGADLGCRACLILVLLVAAAQSTTVAISLNKPLERVLLL